MLFAHLNGSPGRAVEDGTEVDVLQNLACEIGPSVQGIRAPRSMPQSMGAFVTAGAQNACAGRGQQREQHTTTSMYNGFGLMRRDVEEQLEVVERPLPLRTSTTTTTPTLIRVTPQTAAAMETAAAKAEAAQETAQETATVAPTSVVPVPLPSISSFPKGTITAFDSKTNRWRIAVQNVRAGFVMSPTLPEFTEVPSAISPPTDAMQVTQNEFDKKIGKTSIFKKPLFWVAVGGGTLLLVGGGTLLFRRRKKASAY